MALRVISTSSSPLAATQSSNEMGPPSIRMSKSHMLMRSWEALCRSGSCLWLIGFQSNNNQRTAVQTSPSDICIMLSSCNSSSHELFKLQGLLCTCNACNLDLQPSFKCLQSSRAGLRCIQVPTVDGPVDLKIPAGTQPGTTLLMSKRGVPKLGANRSVRGDQQVCATLRGCHALKVRSTLDAILRPHGIP